MLVMLALGSLVLSIVACNSGLMGGLVASQPDQVEVTLAAFVVTRTAHERLIPKFVAKWEAEHGQNVHFYRSYGASGSQTRAVIDGLDADIVHLALAFDTQRLVKGNLVNIGWEQGFPNQSVVTRSVIALATREGNPKNIRNWSDLARPDLTLVTPDPRISGVARWNFMGLWTAAMQTYQDEAKATEFVTQVYQNVPVMTRDAREATDVFVKQGQADVLLNYENEMILAQQKGVSLSYSVPAVNLAIDNPIAIVDRNVDKHRNRKVAEAYIRYLYTPEAQLEFAKLGFRTVPDSIAQEHGIKFPVISTLKTVQDYGGWTAVHQKFFADGALFEQILSRINR
jgi:sulfate/thiosulfate transport system substrate-binding protein